MLKYFSLSCFVLGASLFSEGDCTSSGNPYQKTTSYYVNPSYQQELSTSISTSSGATKDYLVSMQNVSSAYWIDVKRKVQGTATDSMEGILMDAASKSSRQLVTFIVYDLPNRDCHAKASNGEICCTYNADKTCNYDASGDCSAGIKEYQTTYIDPMYAVLDKYDEKVEIVLVIEPDSLPNLVTNAGDNHCGNTATTNAYKTGVAYTVNKFASLKVTMYIDAAHGGWLGWEDNTKGFVSLIASMQFNDRNNIRGFSTNVANYQPIGAMCPWQSADGFRNDYCLNNQHQTDACCSDPCGLEKQWNPANNELNFVNALYHNFVLSLPGYTPHFIIDSGRNGVADMRTDCSNWCNVRDAGIGLKPTYKTANTDIVDAYYWLKTPGESDGCTSTLPDGSACKRYDSMCGSVDSLGSKSGEPRAPEAGQWFDYQIKQLASHGV